MKKARNMFVLALVLLSVISIGSVAGTYAKYTTSETATDEARVAKFGVTLTKTTGSAFAKEYATTDTTATSITNSVVAETNVVAPGTNGSLATVSISGTPEVAVRVATTATVDLGDDWMVDGSFYCPLEITVGTDTIKGTAYTSVEDFENAIKEKLEAVKADYAAGTDLSTASTSSLSWKWAFEGNDDVKDTALGNKGNATISISVSTSVTQID